MTDDGDGGGAVPDRLVPVIAVVTALGAAAAGCRPTGSVLDPVLVALFAAAVVGASGRARWWAAAVPVATGVALARGWDAAPALVAVPLMALAVAAGPRAGRWLRVAAVGLSLQSLLPLPDLRPHGTSAAVVAVAVGIVVASGGVSVPAEARPALVRRARRVALVVGAVVLLSLGLALLAARDLTAGEARARQGLEDVRAGRTERAAAVLDDAAGRFDRAHRLLSGPWGRPARAVPVLAQHVRAMEAAAAHGATLTEEAATTAGRARYQDLRSDGGRFDLDRLAAVERRLAVTSRAVGRSLTALDRAGSPWLLPPVADALVAAERDLRGARAEADVARRALAVAPDLLGGEGPRRYFVAFVTPAELRGSGGFIGSYAELTAADGRLELGSSGSILDAESRLPSGSVEITGPPEYLDRYGRFRPEDFFRDVTFSPHFPYDAEVISEVYPQTGGGEVDGVISVDPIALAALLRLTGPVRADGFDITLDADNAAQFLLEDNYSLFDDPETQNRALSEVVDLVFRRLTTGDLPGPAQVVDALGPVTAEGRIRLWSPVAAEQEFFRTLGATGELPPPRPDHDLLAVASQNAGNNKLDVYQRREVDYRLDLDRGGALEATVRVTVHNDVSLDADLPAYVVGNRQGDPPGTNTMTLSVYTPHTFVAARIDGRRVGIDSGVEAGHRVYSHLISVPPGGSVTFEVDLEGRLEPGDRYVLDLAPQPTVHGDLLTVRLTGAQRARRGPLDVLGRERIVLEGR